MILLCGFALSLLVVLATTQRTIASGITHYVNINSANPVAPYLSTVTAATTIQAAIDVATAGDTVVVAPGTYLLSTPVVVNKGIYVVSSAGSGSTFIDGNKSTHCLDISDPNATVEGFTVQNGTANYYTSQTSPSRAGGVNLTAGTLTECVVTRNRYIKPENYAAGGILCENALVTRCTIEGNSTYYTFPTTVSGGIWVGEGGIIQDSVISDNHALDGYGGGVGSSDGGLVERCVIRDNDAGPGGGVYCLDGTVRDCEIAGNKSLGSYEVGRGGGVFLDSGTIEDCLIYANEATGGGDDSRFASGGEGGGVFVEGGSVRNCTVVGNNCGDLHYYGFRPGRGGGIYLAHDDSEVANCILYFNTATEGANLFLNSGVVRYSCSTPLAPGPGNISSDPQFANASGHDYHLLPTSPCIDTGLNEAWITGAVDLDGNQRILNGDVDMGAYEFQAGSSPEFTFCPNNPTVSTDAGVCSALLGFDTAASGFPVPTVTCTLNGTPINSPFNFPKGANEVTCTAINPLGQANCSFTVTVNDMENPVIQSVTPSQSVLSPPNHKMVPVTLSVSATDNCGIARTKIASVSSSEPALGTGAGNTASDWQITGDLSVQLRAERSGPGSGRVYSVTVEVTDQAGNKSHKSTTVTVPH